MAKKERMNSDEFSKMLKGLEDAFSHKISAKSATAYWQYLQNVPKEYLERRVKYIVLSEDRFPSIARLAKPMFTYGEDWND